MRFDNSNIPQEFSFEKKKRLQVNSLKDSEMMLIGIQMVFIINHISMF